MSAKDQIKQIVDYFKREPQLKDKTDGMAEGLLLGAQLADDANELSKETDASFKALQREYTENGNGSQTTAEITVARDGELVLDDRLKRDFGNVNAQLAQKASISYLDSVLSAYSGGGVKDVFYSLDALNTMHPNGAMGPMLVYDTAHTDGAHQYTWVVDRWKDIGLFNPEGIAKAGITSNELARNSVQADNINNQLDYLKSSSIEKRVGRLTQYDTTTGLPVFNTEEKYVSYKIPLPSTGKISSFLNPSMTGVLHSMMVDADNKRVFNFSVSNVLQNTTGESWIHYENNRAVIDITDLKKRVENLVKKPTHVWITYLSADANNAFGIKVVSSKNYEWLYFEKEEQEVSDYKIILPSTVPLARGRQLNVYYENILYNTMLKNVVKLTAQQSDLGGSFYENMWQVKPDYDSLTNKLCTFNLSEKKLSEITMSNTFNLVTIPDNMTNEANVLIIGDSKISNGIIVGELVKLFNNDSMSVSFKGTLGTSPANHEGRAGWSAKNYCKDVSFNNSTNPFINPSTGKFDFSYYVTQSGVTGINVVSIDLGTNDAVQTTDFLSILSNYDEMINSIKAYKADMKILIGLTENMNQEKFVFNLNKNRILGFVKALIDHYDNRKNENIYLIPLYLNINLYLDYNYSEIAESDRNPTLIKRVLDETHQANSGYFKNADMIYSTIKYAFV